MGDPQPIDLLVDAMRETDGAVKELKTVIQLQRELIETLRGTVNLQRRHIYVLERHIELLRESN